MQHLFVYGTLAKGRKNAHVLESIGGKWTPASVQGRLVAQGWGAIVGYPGLILDEKGEQINGFVFSSPSLRDNWRSLDDFEGVDYKRVVASISLSIDGVVDAFVYVLNDQNRSDLTKTLLLQKLINITKSIHPINSSFFFESRSICNERQRHEEQKLISTDFTGKLLGSLFPFYQDSCGGSFTVDGSRTTNRYWSHFSQFTFIVQKGAAAN